MAFIFAVLIPLHATWAEGATPKSPNWQPTETPGDTKDDETGRNFSTKRTYATLTKAQEAAYNKLIGISACAYTLHFPPFSGHKNVYLM